MRRLVAALALLLLPCAAGAGPVATQFHGGPDHTGVFAGAEPGNLITQRWSFDTGNRVVASPIVADGALFIGSRSGVMHALDKKTGAERWHFTADGPITATAAVADGMVFFATDRNTLYAVDAVSGAERWHRTTGADVEFHSLSFMPQAFNWDFWHSSPLYWNGVVYAGSGDGKVYALDAATGAVRWTFATANRVRATPATDGKAVYIGSFDGAMYALDIKNGRQLWKYQTEGNPYFRIGAIQSSPALAGGLVLFGSRDYYLYALDAKSGKLAWRNQHKDSWVISTPAVRDGRVYVGSSDGLFVRCVDLKTGAELWTKRAGTNIYSSGAIVGQKLYIGTFAGDVFGLALSDGAAGGLTLEDRVYGSPWIEDGVLYIGSNDGLVYALSDGVVPEVPK